MLHLEIVICMLCSALSSACIPLTDITSMVGVGIGVRVRIRVKFRVGFGVGVRVEVRVRGKASIRTKARARVKFRPRPGIYRKGCVRRFTATLVKFRK